MTRTPDELRKAADQCRYLASTCLTEQARQPLNETADELEREAEIQQQVRDKSAGHR